MYEVYILESVHKKGYYIGHAAEEDVRLQRHNTGKVRSTRAKAPWKVVHREHYSTKQEAYRRERQIKSYKGGEAFRKLIGKK